MLKIINVFFLSLFFLPIKATAAEWVEVMKFENRSEFVDISNLSNLKDGKLEVWVKSAYKSIQFDRDLNVSYDTFKNLFVIDCNGNKIALKSAAASLNGEGVLRETIPETEPLRFSPVVPDSLGEVITSLCKQGK